MKKILCIGLMWSAAYALPLVNPVDSVIYTQGIWDWDCFERDCFFDCFSMRLGFYGDYVYNRHLQVKDTYGSAPGNVAQNPENATVKKTRVMTNAGLVLFNYADWIEVYATFGVTNFQLRGSTSLFGDPTPVLAEQIFSPAVSYTVGAAAPIWTCNDFVLGVQAQYFYTKPRASAITTLDTGTIAYFNHSDDAKYLEYQGAIAASWTFDDWANLSMVPFLGIQFSGVSWNQSTIDPINMNSVLGFSDLEQQKVVGWTIGASLIMSDTIGVTAEGRFANEKALHVNGQMRF